MWIRPEGATAQNSRLCKTTRATAETALFPPALSHDKDLEAGGAVSKGQSQAVSSLSDDSYSTDEGCGSRREETQLYNCIGCLRARASKKPRSYETGLVKEVLLDSEPN